MKTISCITCREVIGVLVNAENYHTGFYQYKNIIKCNKCYLKSIGEEEKIY